MADWLNRAPLRGLFLFWALVLLAACDKQPPQVTLSGQTMGTGYKVTYRTTEEGPKQEEVRRLVVMMLESIEDKMSTYRKTSELSRFNGAGTEPFDLSPETLRVMREAKLIGERSGGALDVTVGPLVDLWGFGPSERQGVPSDEAIAEARSHVGLDKLTLDPKALQAKKTDPALQVDLSAIAKGYAVDQVSELLGFLELHDHLVDIGGELRANGTKADGQSWRIGIEQPDAPPGEVAQVLELRNHSMATSGDYRNYFEADGKRYAHGIDPQTGRPAENHLASVSVIHPSCMTADGWATALMVLGEDRGAKLAERLGLMAHFIYREGDGFKVKDSTAFTTFLEQQKTP
ncbi:MAG: FAD:protein FMN transferase [bacterium]|nr:FAD:protein FMN transferase [bacterium]